MDVRALGLGVIAASMAIAACGGSTGGTTPSPSASIAPTPTPTPVASPLVVWAVTTGSSKVIRTLTPAGGVVHTIATIPAASQILGVGAGKLAYLSSALSLHIVGLATGADASYSTGASPSSDTVFGAAISPDGTLVAYVVSSPSSGGRLRILTVATGASATIRTYPAGPVDAPVEWTSTRIVATTIVPFSDAGPQAAVGLDPATGAQVFSTSISGSSGPEYSGDGTHVANSVHTAGLGDDGDVTAAVGAPMPFNTLRTFSLGSSPTGVVQKAHHNINVLAVSQAGTQVLYSNDSSAGGFAGITLSPDFGLFTFSAGTPRQLEKLDGPRWDAAAFIDDTTAFAARHMGSNEELTVVGGSHATPSVVDTVAAGDQPVFVGYSPTS